MAMWYISECVLLNYVTYFRVRIQAVNGIGVGPFSTAVKFTTRALPPRPPKLECCGTAHNSIKLKWGEGRNTDLITYTLEMDRDDGRFVQILCSPDADLSVSCIRHLLSTLRGCLHSGDHSLIFFSSKFVRMSS